MVKGRVSDGSAARACLAVAGLLACACACAGTCGRTPAGAGASKPRGLELLVAEEHHDRVAFLDPDSLEVLGRAETGPAPHVVVVDAQRRRAFVSAYHAEGSPAAVSVLDLDGRRLVASWALASCRKPHGLALDDASRLWVTCEEESAVIVLDTATGAAVRREELPGDGTHMLTALEGGRRIAATHLRSAWISVLGASTAGVVERVAIPRGAEALAVAPDGTWWATDPGMGTLTVLAPDRRLLRSDVVGDTPIHVLVEPDLAAVHVAADGAVLLLDPSTGQLRRRLELDVMGGDLARPRPDRLVVTDALGGRVLLLSLPDGRVVRETKLPGGANHLALAPR